MSLVAPLPTIPIPEGARRSRITGSQVYGFFHCEHIIHLDFNADESRKLPPGPELARLFERGRAHEASVVAPLGYAKPEYEEGDFEAGARGTLALLREGVKGVEQGVLRDGSYLGVPDLLRREPGESDLGDFHYVVGDVKSSYKPRSDQALQVTFYTHLLGRVQGRLPDEGFLILRDGREERVDVRALTPILIEILNEMAERVSDGSTSRPHRSFACCDCGWRAVCGESPDVYWIPGLTRSARSLLDRAGFRTLESLCAADPRREARGHVLSEATWQKARSCAEALLRGRALPVRAPRLKDLVGRGRPVVVLRDPFDARFAAFGSLDSRGLRLPRVNLALTPAEENEAFRSFLGDVAGDETLCHSGGFGRALYELGHRVLHLSREVASTSARGVNLMGIVRGAYAFPAPVRTPTEALALLDGRNAEVAVDVELLIASGDREALHARAEAELLALDDLLARLRREWS